MTTTAGVWVGASVVLSTGRFKIESSRLVLDRGTSAFSLVFDETSGAADV
jgi:hypothetical protein